MALEFFTGFEGCGSHEDARALFDTCDYIAAYSATGGFDDGKSSLHSGAGYWFQKSCTAAKTKSAGSHIRGANTLDNTHENYAIFRFEGPDIRIFNWSDGIRVYRETTLLGTGSAGLTKGLHHIEAKVFSDASAGTVTVKIDGTTVLDLSGVNTGGSDITTIRWGATSVLYRDNYYIADDFQGELISVLCKPSSDDSVQFTPSTGSDNYAMIDEVVHDDDTTYVESSTVGHKDIYEYENIPSGYTVVGISLFTMAKKDDAGARVLQPISVQDTTERDIGSAITLTTGYPATTGSANRTTLGVAPDGTAWSNSKFNDCKWGFEVAS